MQTPFTFLLLPQLWAMRNRARRRERGDLVRAAFFGVIGIGVCAALFSGAYWLTLRLAEFQELGDYLLRLGLSWLFLTFLAFLAFSGVVTSLSTFFLATISGCCSQPRFPRRACSWRASPARWGRRHGWSSSS